MGTSNRDFVQGADGVFPTAAYQVLVYSNGTTIAQGKTDVELASLRVPGDGDWQIVDIYMWCSAIAGAAPTIEIQDDGTDITSPVAVLAGAQTEVPLTTSPTRVKGGSELQIMVDTSAASETITDLVVTITLRPYPLGEGGVAVT